MTVPLFSQAEADKKARPESLTLKNPGGDPINFDYPKGPGMPPLFFDLIVSEILLFTSDICR